MDAQRLIIAIINVLEDVNRISKKERPGDEKQRIFWAYSDTGDGRRTLDYAIVYKRRVQFSLSWGYELIDKFVAGDGMITEKRKFRCTYEHCRHEWWQEVDRFAMCNYLAECPECGIIGEHIKGEHPMANDLGQFKCKLCRYEWIHLIDRQASYNFLDWCPSCGGIGYLMRGENIGLKQYGDNILWGDNSTKIGEMFEPEPLADYGDNTTVDGVKLKDLVKGENMEIGDEVFKCNHCQHEFSRLSTELTTTAKCPRCGCTCHKIGEKARIQSEVRAVKKRISVREIKDPIVKQYDPREPEQPEVFIKTYDTGIGIRVAVCDKFGDHMTTLFTLDHRGINLAPNVDVRCGIETDMETGKVVIRSVVREIPDMMPMEEGEF